MGFPQMSYRSSRHYIYHYRDMPMPKLRDDAYYGAYMHAARKELEANQYAFDLKDGREFECGREVSRYSNPADYNPADFASHMDIWEWIFARAIKARAAQLHNIANR
jgi:hypothetical protein